MTAEAANGTYFGALRAQLKRSARLKTVSIMGEREMERVDYKVSLMGAGAEASLYGLYTPHNSAQVHVNVLMEHQSPHTTSKQLFKGVLSDASRASFEGKIYVHQEAQKTDAFQLSNHLLLSPNVVANSKPNLEIFADDVKASHGATVGQIDPELLFYLKARGVDEQLAKQLLIEGFKDEIICQLPCA